MATLSDRIGELATKRGEELQAAQPESTLVSATGLDPVDTAGFVGGFLRSSFDSLGEMIGVDPSLESIRFRREHPLSGFISEFVTPVGVYGGVYKLSKTIRPLRRAIQGLGDASKAPIKTGALQEVARFAPFEAGRIGLAAGFGDEGNLGEVAVSAGANVVLASGIGAGIGLISSFGKRAADISRVAPGIELDAPTPVVIRQLRDRLKTGDIAEGLGDQAQLMLVNLEKQLRVEEIIGKKAGERYVSSLELGASGAKGAAQSLSRLFNVRGTAKGFSRKLLARLADEKGFKTQAEVQAIITKAGLPEDATSFMQFPRVLQAKTAAGAKTLQKKLNGSLLSVGGGFRLAKEGDEGLFILSKKIQGTAKSSKADDEYIIFKTDSPGKFLPEASKYADKVANQSAFLKRTDKAFFVTEGVAIREDIQFFQDELPFFDFRGATKGKTLEQSRNSLREAIGIKGAKDGPGSQFVENADNFVRAFLAPRPFQFTNSPRALHITRIAEIIHGRSEAFAEQLLFGEQKFRKATKFIFGSRKGETLAIDGKPSINALIDPLTKQDLSDVVSFMNRTASLQDIKKELLRGDISERVFNLMQRLDEVDADRLVQIRGTIRATGVDNVGLRQNHFGLTRTFRGTERAEVVDADGQLVFLASGRNRNAAQDEAQFIIENAAKDGTTLRLGQSYTSTLKQDLTDVAKLPLQSQDFALASSLRERHLKEGFRPKQFRERTGTPGTPDLLDFSKDELREIIGGHLTSVQKWLADVNLRDALSSDLMSLAAENPGIFDQVLQRLDDFAGLQGQIPKAINKAVDVLLAPALGTNSGSKIASTANQLMLHFQLGMGNIMFPVLNAATFMQTSLPQVSFVLNASPASLAKYYGFTVLPGANGLPRAATGFLEPIRVARQSFKELGKPSKALLADLDRLAAEGVIDPRLIEEVVGQNSRQIIKFRETLESQGYVGWMKAVSEFLPASSEKFARAHSAVMGHILGRDVLMMAEGSERLFQFAREFTNNTMFLYSTADRARLISGPVGSMFGLFKNWQMHYMGWMLEYTGQALKGNLAPLAWQTAGTAFVGGIGALPFYGAAEAFSQAVTEKGLTTQINEIFENDTVADGIMMGVPALLGASLQASAAAPLADPIRDASMLFNFVHADRIGAFGKAVGSAVDVWAATGTHPIKSGKVRDQFIRALAPRSVFRATAVAEGNYLKSLSSGNPTIRGLEPWERMMFALGFNPTKVERNFAIAQELWKSKDKMRTAVSTFGQLWSEAQLEGDSRMMSRLLTEMTLQGVPIDRVMRSSQSRIAKQRGDLFDQFDEIEVLRRRRILEGDD